MQYLAVGGWNTLAGYGTFVIMYHFLGAQLGYSLIILMSYVVAILNAYLGYRYVTFRSHASVRHEFPRFSAVYLATMVVNLLVLPPALRVLPFGAVAVQGLFTVGVVVASYLGHKYFSFRDPTSSEPSQGVDEADQVSAGHAAASEKPVPGGE